MTPPTLKQILEKATPGRWNAENGICDKHGNKIASVIFCGYEDPVGQANAQLIARCSPSVMLAVVEALENAQEVLAERQPWHAKYCETTLNLLNGKAP